MSLLKPTSESEVRQSLLEVARKGGCHAMAVENLQHGHGTPDVNLARTYDAWVETKFFPFKKLAQGVFTKGLAIKLNDREVRPAQRVWHTERHRAGNERAFFLVVITFPAGDVGWYLIHGHYAAAHLGRTMTLLDLDRTSILPTNTRRPTPEELIQCLSI